MWRGEDSQGGASGTAATEGTSWQELHQPIFSSSILVNWETVNLQDTDFAYYKIFSNYHFKTWFLVHCGDEACQMWSWYQLTGVF